jgi:hypothetical protein
MVGEIHTSSVHTKTNMGNNINVIVNPHRFMTNPVPNSENKKDMLFVVCPK